TRPATASAAVIAMRIFHTPFVLSERRCPCGRTAHFSVRCGLTANRCSDRTPVPMVASILVPGFELKAALRRQPRLALRPAALAPCPGEEPLVGAVTTAAAAAGVSPGMRLGEALATCPQLVLVERDPAGVEEAWEGILRRLEEHGFAVEPVEPGCLYFETRGVERLYG